MRKNPFSLKNKPRRVRGIALYLGVVAIFLAFWLQNRRAQQAQVLKQIEKEKVGRLQKDRELFKSSQLEGPPLYNVLFRLAKVGQDGLALNWAKKKAKVNSSRERKVAALILGHYPDEKSLQDLEGLLKDRHELVRLGAIEAMSFYSSSERRAILDKYLQKEAISFREKARIYGSLYLLTSSLKEKKRLLKKIKELGPRANKSDGFYISLILDEL